MKFLVSTKEVANFFDLTPRTIQLWAKNGCPREARGRYNLKQVFIWWLENIQTDDSDKELKKWKRHYWKAKSHMEHAKLDEILGDLISKDEIKKEWVGRVAVVTSGLESLAERLPLVLEGKPKDEMMEIIKAEIRELRESYARPSTWCPGI